MDPVHGSSSSSVPTEGSSVGLAPSRAPLCHVRPGTAGAFAIINFFINFCCNNKLAVSFQGAPFLSLELREREYKGDTRTRVIAM